MKVCIFGASGATGSLLTERCLAVGHEVAALLRQPASFPWREQVRVVEGNAFDPDAIGRAIEGAEAVFSALGARSLRREDVLERAVPLIVEAMRQSGVRRIIALGSAGARDDSMKRQPAYRRWIVHQIIYKTILKWPVASQVAQWEALSASDLDWTMVLPPMLTDGPGRGNYRVDGEALPVGASRISRADVADFMMRQLAGAQWIGKGVYIAW